MHRCPVIPQHRCFFSVLPALGEALTDLFENGRINKIDGMKNAAHYSCNDDRYTITLP